MIHDTLVRLEKLARDAVRALEPFDPTLSRSLRLELNALSTVAIGTPEQPQSRAMRVERAAQFLLKIADEVPSSAERSEQLEEIRLLLAQR